MKNIRDAEKDFLSAIDLLNFNKKVFNIYAFKYFYRYLITQLIECYLILEKYDDIRFLLDDLEELDSRFSESISLFKMKFDKKNLLIEIEKIETRLPSSFDHIFVSYTVQDQERSNETSYTRKAINY
jgi:hypothetical protein